MGNVFGPGDAPEPEELTTIYALVDPKEQTFYTGRSIKPETRFSQHASSGPRQRLTGDEEPVKIGQVPKQYGPVVEEYTMEELGTRTGTFPNNMIHAVDPNRVDPAVTRAEAIEAIDALTTKDGQNAFLENLNRLKASQNAAYSESDPDAVAQVAEADSINGGLPPPNPGYVNGIGSGGEEGDIDFAP